MPSTTTSNFTDSFTIAASSPTPTKPTGGSHHACPADPSAVSFSNGLGSAPTGHVRTSWELNHFTGVVNPSRLQVESYLADSIPQALAISLAHGGSAYVSRSYDHQHMKCRLSFAVLLGHRFNIGPASYMVLAQTHIGTPGNTSFGVVSLNLGGSGNLFIQLTDGYGHTHYLYPSGQISVARWYRLSLREITGSNGSVQVWVNGSDVGTISGIDLGTGPLKYFAVGNEYTPPSDGAEGNLYIDNVAATGSG